MFKFICSLLALIMTSPAIYAYTGVDGREENNNIAKPFGIAGNAEVAFSRNFHSDNPQRYKEPGRYAKEASHGRFDIPHAVISMSYDFGKGWTMCMEVEFEHTGVGATVESEEEESEYEAEIEKGGEVGLEQFWLQKSFSRWANIRLGYIVVPVGLNNAHHEPLDFFTVYRPEGENTILPNIWHDTGISFWGRLKHFRYEFQMVAGLNALQFGRDSWVHKGVGSAYEFKPANKYGFVLRLDNYSVTGLRIGLSGYVGQAMHNASPNEMEGKGKPYDGVKAMTYIGAFDFTFNRFNWIVRGQADYGYISGAQRLSVAKENMHRNSSWDKTNVGKNAYAIGIEAGYDLFSQFAKLRDDNQKFYLFGRYETYNSHVAGASQPVYSYTARQRMVFGVNYFPVPQIAIKANYANRIFKSGYNNEPSINIGIAYEGFFL